MIKYNNNNDFSDIKDYWLLEPVGGLGEAFVSASLMKTYKEKFGGKVLFITNSKSKYDLLKTFEDIDRLLLLSPNTDPLTLQNLIKNNKVIDINIYKEDSYLATDMVDRTKHCLGLEGDIEITKPKISEEDEKATKEIFDKLGLKEGKTVFLSPWAHSCNYKVLSEEFWSNLADEFIKKGYEVVFNVSQDCYTNYKRIYMPINQVIPFANLCSQVISFRSGLVDVIAGTTETKLTVIYAGDCHQFAIAFTNKDLIDITKKFYRYDDEIGISENFLMMELINIISDSNNIEQLVFDGDEAKLIKQIAK